MESKRYIYIVFTWLIESILYLLLASIIGIKEQGILFFYCVFFGSLFIGNHFQLRQVLIWTEIKDLIITHFIYLIFSSLAIFTFYDPCLTLLLYNVFLTVVMLCITLVYGRSMHILLRDKLARKTLIIGTGNEALHLAFLARTNRFALIDVVGLIDFYHSGVEEVDGYKVYPLEDMKNVVDQYNITQIIISLPEIEFSTLSNMMQDLSKVVNNVKYIPRTNGMMNYDSEIQDFDGILLISTVRKKPRILSRIVKRFIDICGGIIGCLLLIPITIVLKIKFIKEGDHEPIFFKQKRIGKHGKPIYIYKYRSMVPNAESILEEMMENDPVIRKEYLENKKLRNDPRITPLGEKLRTTSLDEFPQLINILKGDMSLVGPRPYLFREIEDMDFYEDIIQCKPGLTGMWQVSGRNAISFKDRCSLDEYYYLNWSIWLDFTIFIKTIKPVLTRQGSM